MLFSALLLVLAGAFADATENVAFYFREEPQDIWVALGGSLELSCSTSTTVDKTWTWTLHQDTEDSTGTVLDESTSNTLVYGSATAALNGMFITCSADVFGTKLISRYAIVRVSYLDADFLEQPEDVTIESGSDHVRLNCNPPGGRPDPYVTWQKDGQEVDAANTYVDPLGGLNILNVDEGWGGSYTCTAHSFQDHESVVSRAATLTVSGSTVADSLSVTYDVSFAKSRYKISAMSGDSVRVVCGFLGNPTPSFTLSAGSTQLTSSASQEVGSHGTWANVHETTVDEFQCQGSNAGGSQTLNIVVELTGSLVVAGGMEVEILEEESTTLICSETGPSEEPNYSWYLNGVELAGETHKYLELVDAARSQSGMYQCFAATSYAKEHATFAVTVQGIEAVPVKVTVTSDEYGLVGESAQLSCVGQGNPVPSVTWHRNEGNSENAIPVGDIVYKETFTQILAVLVVENLTMAEGGVEYICKGTNQDLYDSNVEYNAESSITLSVVDAIYPSISLPSTSTMISGTSLTLICSVEGSPPPAIQWYKDGVLLEEETDEKYITSGEPGTYTCTATNMLGVITQEVVVLSKPEFSGGEIFLLLIIAAFILLVLIVGLLIVIRRNELDRRMKEARAKEELLLENDKRLEVIPIAAQPYRVTPTPEPYPGFMEDGLPGTPGFLPGTPGFLPATPGPAVSEAECQTPRMTTPRPFTPQSHQHQ